MKSFAPSQVAVLLIVWAILFAVGFFQGHTLHAPDFKVFYVAGSHILNSNPDLLYTVSPDRYLYAPGFAWILSFFSRLPFDGALLAWNGLKFFVLPVVLFMLIRKLKSNPMIATLALISTARPILIDLRYGQINLFVLLALLSAAFGFSEWVKGSRSKWIIFSFLMASLLACAKLYGLPFLLLPIFWVMIQANPARSFRLVLPLLLAMFAGVVLVGLLPFLTLGFDQGVWLTGQWVQALSLKGFPLETHNQSFLGFIARQFTEQSVHVIGLAKKIDTTWFALFDESQLKHLGMAWMLFSMGIVLAHFMVFARDPERMEPGLIAISLLILPSHLVWKPYFVFALPLALIAWKKNPIIAFIGALLLNLSNFSILGLWIGPRAESASIFFFAMLLLYAGAIRRPVVAKAS